MATLITNASALFTGAATFAATETGALAAVLNRNTTTTIAAATTVTSVTFTVTNAKVIDAVLLLVKQSGTSTGTMKVDLQKGGVSQASVTVNKADLPTSTSTPCVPVLFKLTTTATGDGGANWTIVITTTGTGTITIQIASATVTNFTRALRTTTAATIAAADNAYFVGELTGAGTNNPITVTMNNTNTTAFGSGVLDSTTVAGGGFHVGHLGSLVYDTAASTNYILQLNGDLFVYGTFTIDNIPRTSTAALYFQLNSANGDFGFEAYSATINLRGLSRTSGKNVAWARLTADTDSSNRHQAASPSTTNMTQTNNSGLDATNTTRVFNSCTDTVTNGNHTVGLSGGFTATGGATYTAFVHFTRGTGTNNRFVRLYMGSSTALPMTNGFYVDADLQAVTVGTPTAIGTGTAASATITAVGTGFRVTVTGTVASTNSATAVLVAACSAAGTISFAGANNQCFIYGGLGFVDGSSYSGATYNIDEDCGWLNGDVVCTTTTIQNYLQSELLLLNADAGVSSFTTTMHPICYPFGNSGAPVGPYKKHHGTWPLVTEVGLLTRNVKLRSTSSTLHTYFYFDARTVVTAEWVEFSNYGGSTDPYRGLTCGTGAAGAVGAKDFSFCSFHDTFNQGIIVNSTSNVSANVSVTDCVFWNCDTGIQIESLGTNADFEFSRNLIIRPNFYGFYLSSLRGIVDDNVVSAGKNIFTAYVLSANQTINSFARNTAHGGGNGGLLIESGSNLNGVIDEFTSYRTSGYGVSTNMGATYTAHKLSWNNLKLFGNGDGSTTYPQFPMNCDMLCLTGTDNIICGDTHYPSGYGIGNALFSKQITLELANLDMTGATLGAPGAVHTVSEFYFSGSTNYQHLTGQANNIQCGAPDLITGRTAWQTRSYISFQKFNNAGEHRTEMQNGTVKTDDVLFHDAAPAMRMVPVVYGAKLESAPKKVFSIGAAALSGTSVNVSVWLYKSSDYTGSQPRLILRASPALGIDDDVVIAACTDTGPASPSYANPGGAGDRLSLITITTNITPGGSAFPALVDGLQANAAYFTVRSSAYMTFDFGVGASNIVNEIKWYQDASASHGSWVMGGSNDDSSYTEFPESIALGTGPTGTFPFTNTTGYRYYRLRQTSGSTTNGPYTREIEFKIVNSGGTSPGTATWVQISGTTPVITDDGVLEFVIDCDGTAGYVDVDDWAFSGGAIGTNDLSFWVNGLPAGIGGIGGGGGGGSFSAGFF